jgi:hypothetical protein
MGVACQLAPQTYNAEHEQELEDQADSFRRAYTRRIPLSQCSRPARIDNRFSKRWGG